MLEKWREVEALAKAAWDEALRESEAAKLNLSVAEERERAASVRAQHMADLYYSTTRMVRFLTGEEQP